MERGYATSRGQGIDKYVVTARIDLGEGAQSVGGTSYFLRAFSIFAESVTKPKHFFTFQIVASVQKSGEVVAQQSSISTQP